MLCCLWFSGEGSQGAVLWLKLWVRKSSLYQPGRMALPETWGALTLDIVTKCLTPFSTFDSDSSPAPPLALKQNSNHALFAVCKGTLTPAPHCHHHKPSSQSPLPVLSSHFQTCLRARPALSWKPHYVSNKTLSTLLLSVWSHRFSHLKQILGARVYLPPSGCHTVERR